MKRGLIVMLAAVCCVAPISCGEDGPTPGEQARDAVVTTLTALYSGDVDTYIQNSDFGEPLDSTKVMLLRAVLNEYVSGVRDRGGLKGVVPVASVKEADSVYAVSYELKYNDGTVERCIKKVRHSGGKWNLCIIE